MCIYKYVCPNLNTVKKIKTIINQFPRLNLNICTVTDLYLNSNVSSSGSSPSHCFSLFPAITVSEETWYVCHQTLQSCCRNPEETRIIMQCFICILNKQTPPKRFACENKESLGWLLFRSTRLQNI